jgi:hypothetical protein
VSIELRSASGLSVRVDETVGATLHDLRGPWDGDLLAPGLAVGDDLDASSPFLASGLRGWVDCFPSVSADRLDRGGQAVVVPDHGEMWFRSWNVEAASGTRVVLRCVVAHLGVELTKTVEWVGDDLRCVTTAVNRSAEDLPFLWASHALFDLRADDHVALPRTGPETFAYRHFTGFRPWQEFWPPTAEGRRWGDLGPGTVAKYFLPWPRSGVSFQCHGQPLHLDWTDAPPDAQLGLWANRHAYPEGPAAVSHLGIEPSLGWPDDLSTAYRLGTAPILPAGADQRLSVVLRVGHHPPAERPG